MTKVLIAEDERPIARLLEMNLTRAGYVCTLAPDGLTAADLIEKNDYDLALLDIMLPGLDGYALLDYLRPQGVPVIFLTAKAAVKDRVLGLRLTDSCIIFRPGRERPLLIVSEAGRERGNTVRFSLRRRTPPTTEPDRTADFEPMLDFDTAEPVAPPTPEPAPAESADPGATRHLNVGRTHTAPPAVSEPTGTIRFE